MWNPNSVPEEKPLHFLARWTPISVFHWGSEIYVIALPLIICKQTQDAKVYIGRILHLIIWSHLIFIFWVCAK